MKKIVKAAGTVNKKTISTMRVQDRMEARREPAYSTIRIPAGAFNGLRLMFFAIAQGGSVTEVDTNIVTPSQLPYPQRLTVDTMRLECHITDPKDWRFLSQFFRYTSLRFFIGTKDYQSIPAAKAASRIEATFQGGAADGSKAKVLSQLGCAGEGYKFGLDNVVTIGSKENFGVDLQSTLAFTLNSEVTLRMYLEGIKYVDVR